VIVAGRGNLGRSLAPALKRSGHHVQLVSARTGLERLIKSLRSQPDATVFLTVPDRAVASFANRLSAAGALVPASVAFVHTSGALGLEPLSALAGRHPVGSFHPLQSFPAPRPPAAFQGIVVAVDASYAPLRRRLARLARDLGARPRYVTDEQRVLYHAAGVMASNFLVVIAAEAVRLLELIGWTESEAVAGLVPLMEGALAETATRRPTAALTGPIRRGDAETVLRHLQTLDAPATRRGRLRRPPVADVYRMLGTIALEIAKQAGLDPAAAERVRRALTRKAAATRRSGRR
jgi:predicted short-subunit dehydrogenase-like oxidoreductase (DUF2520 family)